MAINNIQKEKAAGGSYTTTATAINELNCPINERQHQTLTALRAASKIKLYALQRTEPTRGQVKYWAEGWEQIRHLPTLHDALMFLLQIGGRV